MNPIALNVLRSFEKKEEEEIFLFKCGFVNDADDDNHSRKK